ncbi:helix-turn-helix transcriptional regulator [Paenibacillus sp. NRS-1760]|uniref:helix-turn-helix transcriptional regulator n=1 Tax=Paenibacillus sp. NRS-1760 TaxID=3233902 RepID=UPI003D2B70BB
MGKRKSDPRIIQKRLRFKELREAMGKSQRGLSLELHVSESFIRSIENGRSNPELHFAFKIASYLGTTVDDLFNDLAG